MLSIFRARAVSRASLASPKRASSSRRAIKAWSTSAPPGGLAGRALLLENGLDARPVRRLPRLQRLARVLGGAGLGRLQHAGRLGGGHHDDAFLVGDDDVAGLDRHAATADGSVEDPDRVLRPRDRDYAAREDGEPAGPR